MEKLSRADRKKRKEEKIAGYRAQMVRAMKASYDKKKNITRALDVLERKAAMLIRSNPQEQNLIETALERLVERLDEVLK